MTKVSPEKKVSRNKIVLFAPDIFIGGGTERVMVNLANELSASWDVVIAVNDIGKQPLYPLKDNIKVKRFWFGKVRKSNPDNIAVKVINKVMGSFLLKLFFRDSDLADASLIISFSPSITQSVYSSSYRDKLITFEHWPYSCYSKFKNAQGRINRVYPRLRKVVVLTEHEERVYKSLGCNVVKIPNALSFYPDVPARLENKVVLSIGHFNDQKRRDLLIESWKHVAQLYPEWELHIVGDGDKLEESKELINSYGLQKSIKILEPTKNILSHYLGASLYVLSSEFEALPLVLLEAKAAGLPCVSFDIVSGPKEIIHDKQDGFLVNFPDTEMMGKQIIKLIENPELRQVFGERGRLDVQKRFNPENIYSRWNELIEEELEA